MYKKIILSVGILFVAGIAAAVILTGGNFSSYFGRITGISSTITGGGYEIRQLFTEGQGAVNMAGGDYALETPITASTDRLENNLQKAYCYPNPFKPNSGLGHTRITFSRLTSHSKLKVYNLAGELVYEKEADTPNGELYWDAVSDNNERLASGVYVYFITGNDGEKKTGKLAVIR